MTKKKYKDQHILVEVVERKNNKQEAENWQDNLEVTSHKNSVQFLTQKFVI